MRSFLPSDLSTVELNGYLQGSVAPRPIAFASTISEDGVRNLSPFSFFNVFSSNPPILIFSPARRVRDNTIKHTLINARATKEVVINIVDYNIVQQVSLSSTEYPDGVDEFIKSGLTPIKSDIVKPFRVAESPVQYECKVNEIITLGTEGGAGNLIICEVLKLHVSEKILNEEGRIDQKKIDLVSRLGGNWYSRANAGLFEVVKPLSTMGIGVDSIPEHIRGSNILTGNDFGILGNVESLPTTEEINTFVERDFNVKGVLSADDIDKRHTMAKDFIATGDIITAWKVLLAKGIQ